MHREIVKPTLPFAYEFNRLPLLFAGAAQTGRPSPSGGLAEGQSDEDRSMPIPGFLGSA